MSAPSSPVTAASATFDLSVTPDDLTVSSSALLSPNELKRRVQEKVFTSGVVCLPSVLSAETCEAALQASRRLSRFMRGALRAAGVDYGLAGKDWRFEEAAGRCRNRLDYRAGQDEGALARLDAALGEHVGPLVEALLGEEWKRAYGGVVEALPGAEAQGWHVDGGHLFQGLDCPPHALTVFVALCRVDAETGLGSPQVSAHCLQ